MSDNVTLDPGSGGSTVVTREISHAGDTSQLPGSFIMGITGSEGSYTAAAINGDATNGLDVDVTRVSGTVTIAGAVTNAGTFVVQENGAALTSLQLIDDAVYTDATGTPSKGIAVMGTDGTSPQLISVDSSGNVQVDLVTANVTNAGTFAVQAAQSGTWTVDLGATDNAVLDAIAASLAGTLTVGSHAVTNAGTFAVQVDGAALTALQLIDNPVFVDDAAFTLASSSVMVAGAIRDDALSTLTAVEGDAVPLRVSSTGALHVTGAGGGTQYNVDDVAGATDTGTAMLVVRDDTLGALTPADGDYTTLRVNSQGALHVTGGGGGTEYAVDDALGATPTGGVVLAKRDDALSSLTPVEGDAVELRVDANGALWTIVSGTVTVASHAVTNAGTFAVQESGSALTALQLIDNIVNTEDNASGNGDSGVPLLAVRKGTPANTSGTDGDYEFLQMSAGRLWASATIDAALPAGTNAIGKLAANSGVDIGDVDVTSISAGTNLIGDVGLQGRTSGGLSIFRSLDLDETEEDIKTSAGQIYSLIAINLATGVRYLKLYNATAANVTVGSTTPVMTIPIPTQAATANGAGFVMTIPQGIAFDTAICAAATTGVADADTGAPGANEVVLNVLYK